MAAKMGSALIVEGRESVADEMASFAETKALKCKHCGAAVSYVPPSSGLTRATQPSSHRWATCLHEVPLHASARRGCAARVDEARRWACPRWPSPRQAARELRPQLRTRAQTHRREFSPPTKPVSMKPPIVKMKNNVSTRFALLSWFVWALKDECRKAYRNRELSVKTRAPKGLVS